MIKTKKTKTFLGIEIEEVDHKKLAEEKRVYLDALTKLKPGDKVGIEWEGPCSDDPNQTVVEIVGNKIYTCSSRKYRKGRKRNKHDDVWYSIKNGVCKYPAYYIGSIETKKGTVNRPWNF